MSGQLRHHLTRRRVLTGGVTLIGVAVAGSSTVLCHGTVNQISTTATGERPLRTPEEQQFIAATERLRGRLLTWQEANLAIAQPRWFGDL